MSVIPTPYRPLQQFFRSGPMPCPYLPGRIERKLFTRLMGPYAAEINSALSRAGFRRSHDIIYRPVCPTCSACQPVRIPIRDFVPTRSMRRVLRRNDDLTVTELPAIPTGEQFKLFATYQASRHGDSDMARMGLSDYGAMVEEGRADTCLFEVRDAERRLVGVMLADRLADGFSAVYSFFDTGQPGRSLGTFMVLSLIAQARLESLFHVYLGYWIAASRKMAYKVRFQPLEVLGPEGWHRLEAPAP